MIAPSALKHGLSEAEVLHAYRNPIRVWDLGDGLEIGYIQGDVVVVIVHAMRAREKFLR